MAFHDNLRRLRKQANLSQEKLALACGWSGQSRIANYEAGKREPTLEEAALLARALGVSTGELVGGVNEPRPTYQSARLDLTKLAAAQKFLEDLFAANGLPFVASERTIMLAAVYDELLQASTPNMVELATRFGRQLRGDDERQREAGSTGADDRGRDRKAAGAAKAAGGRRR